MDVLIWVLVSLLTMVAVSITVVVLIVRALVKRIRRNRALAAAALRTRARFSSGPNGKVLKLRVRLDETLASGRAAVDLAARGDGPRGELPELFRRIEHEGVGARPATPADGERDRFRRARCRTLRRGPPRRAGRRPGRPAPLGRRHRACRRHRRHAHHTALRRRTRGRSAARRGRGVARPEPSRWTSRSEPHRPTDRLNRTRQGDPTMSDNTSRMRTIFRSKTSKALDKIEDPRETLDDSYNQQVKLLQQVRQALAEVATAKKRIDLQGQEMGARYQRLADQAREALTQGREDLARAALERRSLIERQVGEPPAAVRGAAQADRAARVSGSGNSPNRSPRSASRRRRSRRPTPHPKPRCGRTRPLRASARRSTTSARASSAPATGSPRCRHAPPPPTSCSRAAR